MWEGHADHNKPLPSLVYCTAEAQTVWQICETQLCMAEAHGGWGVPPSVNSIPSVKT